MADLRIERTDDEYVIHFQTKLTRINAYTLASTLVSIADAAKAANDAINPGYDVEVVVEALGGGSFRTRLKAIYTKANNIFTQNALGVVALGVFITYLSEKTVAPNDPPVVKVETDEVVITKGNDRIIVPRNVYDATRKAEQSPGFRRAVSKAADAVVDDEAITGIGFVPRLDSPPPDLILTRDALALIASQPLDEPESRVETEQSDLVIVKAILERGRRKWEFVWRGVKIHAPITDEKFFSDFIDHRITIAPGDELKVRLAIMQSRDARTGIYTNESYEVVEVLGHVPAVPRRTGSAMFD